MFDQVNGLPVHVLVVHAAVVFVPLLVLSAVLYAFVPSLRARLGWVVALLSVGAPACALVAMLSGERGSTTTGTARRRLCPPSSTRRSGRGRSGSPSGSAWSAPCCSS